MHRWWATMPKPAWVAGCAVPCMKRTWQSASQCAERLVGHMPWRERPGVYSTEDAGGTLAVRKETAAHLLKSLEERKISPELYHYGSTGPVGAHYLASKYNVRWSDGRD